MFFSRRRVWHPTACLLVRLCVGGSVTTLPGVPFPPPKWRPSEMDRGLIPDSRPWSLSSCHSFPQGFPGTQLLKDCWWSDVGQRLICGQSVKYVIFSPAPWKDLPLLWNKLSVKPVPGEIYGVAQTSEAGSLYLTEAAIHYILEWHADGSQPLCPQTYLHNMSAGEGMPWSLQLPQATCVRESLL